MSTIIYPSPIFGPVHSRRLGVSLGINLQPGDGKMCTFDCVYCECGFNADHIPHSPRPTREHVAESLEKALIKMREEGTLPDVLTFAGNGEPTGHPDFAVIIDDTIRLRDEYAPEAKVSVLSNATFVHHPLVRAALMKVDNNIQKLDTVDIEYIRKTDRPTGHRYDLEDVIENLALFQGRVIIQSMFMKGIVDGVNYDNTGDHYVLPWLNALRHISPREVMVYTIARETPTIGLQKATPEELNAIRDKVIAEGIPCMVSY
ncbi:MAG: radical SAM protein [Prevotella sp.]|nr:radical SAM protein [Prevotella sp.]